MGIRQQLPYGFWVGYHPGITQDHLGLRDPCLRRASVKRRLPCARRGVRPGQIFVTLAVSNPQCIESSLSLHANDLKR